MYIAVKGGESAIAASRELLDAARRGDPSLAPLAVAQVQSQMGLLVGRVMAEASLYDPELAALALVQAQGDPIEAAFLLRAYRTTLPRFGFSEPVDTDGMRAARRVSAIFKDLPGGQVLGPTYDYTQRLLDFARLREGASADRLRTDPDAVPGSGLSEAAAVSTAASVTAASAVPTACPFTPAPTARDAQAGALPAHSAHPAVPAAADSAGIVPNALHLLAAEGLVEPCEPSAGDPAPVDITRDPPRYPLPRSGRLQMLARADEGWVLGMGYATQRGYTYTHPFGGDIRFGAVTLSVQPDELDFPVEIGEIELTECQMVNQFVGSASAPPQFTRGYGLVFGHGERKAMAMSLVDRALRTDEFDERVESPPQDQEFVLPQGDSVEASGFVQHLKLPHYVTFESELQLIRQLRAERQGDAQTAPQGPPQETQP